MAANHKSPIRLTLAAGLLLAACTANANQESYAMDSKTRCILEDDKHAGATSEDICNAFISAIGETGRDDVAQIVLTVFSASHARATALTASGETLAELDFSIMDRELGLDSWQNLAASLARQLQK